MAKKIRFSLEMENGVEVRSMEELRDNFSISKVLRYLQEGKLITWLRDRYVNDIADSIEKLDLQDKGLAKKLCEIFDVPYDETSEKELEKAAERAERVLRLKEYTDGRQYENVIDNVAFDQDELYDLLDEDANTIYLCGEKFSIPLSKEGIAYIGINQPIVVIDSKVEVDWAKKSITVENVVFDQKYQAVLDSANETKKEIYKKVEEKVKKYSKKKVLIGDYSDKTYLNFMIPVAKKDQVEKMYQMAKKEIEKLNYDIDDDIRDLRKIATENGIINLAERYIEQL